ncbi:uncharacterized protein CXQ87_001455 [Candidozyma duobushaemuli]|nr:uncharacterized protein CXQ87_001455 [[Candida] duobushaemulonis]PVH18524.1 hypothetical protein CXQ87_001455 [[Candida] duobushaemulonis]
MEGSSYYSNSILSSYLKGSSEDLVAAAAVPEISIVPPDGPAETGKSNNRVSSYSDTSDFNSLYSSVSNVSDDTDLESVKLKLNQYETKSRGKLSKLRGLFRQEKPEPVEQDDNTLFFRHTCGRLREEFYDYKPNESLDVAWADACEVFLFGDTLSQILPSHGELLRFVLESSFELGEVKFSNLNKFHNAESFVPEELLRDVLPAIHDFNHVLDLYAESKANAQRPELYDKLIRDANRSDGLCVPLAIAMFGNWLLTYNKSDLTNNYDNALILNYFRKAARLAMALRKLRPVLEPAVEKFSTSDQLLLKRFLNKDTNNALALSLHNLGEYYQHVQNHDVAVTLWELNCQLTHDLESGNLAILGLTNGYGIGNKIKEHKHIGKRSKTNKFNTKRRVAHLYRILLQRPDFHEYGVSWATKEKYD